MMTKKINDLQFSAAELPYPMLRIDLSGKLLFANEPATLFLNAWNLTLGENIPKQFNFALKLKRSKEIEVQVNRANFLLCFSPVDSKRYINIFARDITPRKNYEKQIQQMANFDDLTGLPNRQSFLEQLPVQINKAINANQLTALLVINLKNFKTINATSGVHVGDAVLIEVANRLAECIPEQYLIARLANDEFAVLDRSMLDEVDAANLAQVIIDNLSEPYLIQDHDISIACNIGISIAPNDTSDSKQLLQNAILALTRAKKKGLNHLQFFRRYMRVVATARRSLLKDLRYALERKQLSLYFQPQVNVQANEIVAAEALVRWHHPKHGLMTSKRFTTLAEKRGLIISIGEWVLHEACMQLKIWHERGFSNLRMAVNVSASQFKHDDVLQIVKTVLKESQLPPEYLELEITENILIDNLNSAIKTLNALKKIGVKLAIDDFGTGYSSLSYLNRLPIDKLKIAREFVKDLDNKNKPTSIIDNIIDMAHKMNLQIIAEGVESKSQLEYLKDHHCDLIQGFYFSEPLNSDDFETLLI